MTSSTHSKTLNVLVFAASLRKESLNKKLATASCSLLRHRSRAATAASGRSGCRSAKHYPCIKRAWVEFLGEPPGEGADRVDPLPT